MVVSDYGTLTGPSSSRGSRDSPLTDDAPPSPHPRTRFATRTGPWWGPAVVAVLLILGGSGYYLYRGRDSSGYYGWQLARQLIFTRDTYTGLCFRGDSDCPPCPPGRDTSVTSLLHLSELDYESAHSMIEHVQQAQAIITKHAPDPQSILRLEDLSKLHSSLNYWCCHTPAEQQRIAQIVQNLTWTPIPLRISRTGCNLDHDGQTVYILSLYDAESQDRLYQFVRRIETAMREAGIPVMNPRHQDFHSTIARVQTGTYPVNDVVAQIQQTVPSYTTFTMTKFEMNGEWVYATNASSL